jgi:hypothetical protein
MGTASIAVFLQEDSRGLYVDNEAAAGKEPGLVWLANNSHALTAGDPAPGRREAR